MDIDWALEQLRKYIHLKERIALPIHEVRQNKKTRARGSADELRDIEHVVHAIADATYQERPRMRGEDLVHLLIWELTSGDTVRDKLGLSEPAPSITGSQMHPWVWDAARPHWVSGNHDAAVWAAAVNVNSRLQKKVDRRDIGESKLLAECFSIHPPEAGRPRLRLCDDTNPDLFRDVHRGAGSLGRGLYSAVRNPLNHVDLAEHQIGKPEALEALAGFSLLSRWIDRASVENKDDEHGAGEVEKSIQA
ncbi:hypothetical protein E3T55_06920 [Cryobacterium frigoriphilum]|uniref:Conserved hypothetical protein CHP02391 domain-containing protein n=1 Tax=Cryobacterium frigoriphilum TaxID=1259150 RepID=A0A4R9A4S2_9MICO|nr:TIGR02391 family protein [Cryobacterium frigoriphilum]TFD52187.1 hypothetical protein E3T55_06920 [Cryobacterium frigoriphilum]